MCDIGVGASDRPRTLRGRDLEVVLGFEFCRWMLEGVGVVAVEEMVD